MRTSPGRCPGVLRPRFDEVKLPVEECRDSMTYATAGSSRGVTTTTGEIKSQTCSWVTPGDDRQGTFIINGTGACSGVAAGAVARRVLRHNVDKGHDKDVYRSSHPEPGAWLEFDVDKRDTSGSGSTASAASRSPCC